MPRPTKNNCAYFPHDNDMRNHAKVKSLRIKFTNGYAIWSMLLETLTGNDGNVFEYTDLQFELFCGDFGFSVTEIRDVVDYCIRLEMLFVSDGFVYSESLNENLAPVYKKRGKAKEQSAKQKRKNGVYVTETTDTTVIPVEEIPQRRKDSIREEKKRVDYKNTPLSKIEISDFPELNSDYLKITKSFFELFKANLIDAGASTTNVEKAKGKWIDEIRFIIEIDKYTLEDLRDVYKLLQTNSFWKKNILSTEKLRKQMDKLKLQIKDESTSKNQSGRINSGRNDAADRRASVANLKELSIRVLQQPNPNNI